MGTLYIKNNNLTIEIVFCIFKVATTKKFMQINYVLKVPLYV